MIHLCLANRIYQKAGADIGKLAILCSIEGYDCINLYGALVYGFKDGSAIGFKNKKALSFINTFDAIRHYQQNQ